MTYWEPFGKQKWERELKSDLIIQSEEEGAPAPWAKTTTGDNFPSAEDGDGDDEGGEEAISTSIQNKRWVNEMDKPPNWNSNPNKSGANFPAKCWERQIKDYIVHNKIKDKFHFPWVILISPFTYKIE